MRLYFVESYGDEYPTTHGVYTSRELAEEAKRRYAAEGIREEKADVLPELPAGLFAYRVTWDMTGEPRVVKHGDPWAVWRHPGGGSIGGKITWSGFALNAREAIDKMKAAVPRFIEQEKEMAVWRDATSKALEHAYACTVTTLNIYDDRMKDVTDFKLNHRVQINDR